MIAILLTPSRMCRSTADMSSWQEEEEQESLSQTPAATLPPAPRQMTGLKPADSKHEA